MRNYTVLRSRRSYGAPAMDAEQMTFVKEGFCWPALFVPLLWCLYHRLWLVLAIYLVGMVVLSGVVGGFDLKPGVATALFLGGQALFAAEANDLRRWRLTTRAFEVTGLAYGRNLFEAEMAFFKEWVKDIAQEEQKSSGHEEADVTFRSASEPDELPDNHNGGSALGAPA